MKHYHFRLTQSEREIMQLLWQLGRPLSRSEIIELTRERSWKASSIHILLNSMLEKNAIKVSGFVKSTKNYARTFVPTMSFEEYSAMQICESPDFKPAKIKGILQILLEDVDDPEILRQLLELFESKRKELEEK